MFYQEITQIHNIVKNIFKGQKRYSPGSTILKNFYNFFYLFYTKYPNSITKRDSFYIRTLLSELSFHDDKRLVDIFEIAQQKINYLDNIETFLTFHADSYFRYFNDDEIFLKLEQFIINKNVFRFYIILEVLKDRFDSINREHIEPIVDILLNKLDPESEVYLVCLFEKALIHLDQKELNEDVISLIKKHKISSRVKSFFHLYNKSYFLKSTAAIFKFNKLLLLDQQSFFINNRNFTERKNYTQLNQLIDNAPNEIKKLAINNHAEAIDLIFSDNINLFFSIEEKTNILLGIKEEKKKTREFARSLLNTYNFKEAKQLYEKLEKMGENVEKYLNFIKNKQS